MNIESLLVSGHQDRMFINTGIGCNGGCQYCYLPKIGIGGGIRNIDKSVIIKEVERREKNGEFIRGAQGTIVSFGCFTECWDKSVRKLTMEMLLYFLAKGNYIQIATKEYIEQKDIELLCSRLRFRNQLTINVSMPVYYGAKQIEPNTENVDKRIENFKYNKQYRMDVVLYIKPVLEDITIKSLEVYRQLIQRYDLSVIVGKYLHVNREKVGSLQLVGNQEMWQEESGQQRELVDILRRTTSVYENSIQIIEEYRMKEKTIIVECRHNRVRITFREFVCWRNNSENLVEIQRNLEKENIDQIIVDFNDAVWLDSLMLCQLCLYLEKAADNKKHIEIFLVDRDNIEHVRFVQFLKDAGFVSFMEKIVPGVSDVVNKFLNNADLYLLKKGNFNSLEMLLPFRIIKTEKEIDDVVNEAIDMLSEKNLGENSISFRLRLFLQEVMGNVFEHAYEEGEVAYCGILICRKIRKVQENEKEREYYATSGLEGTVNSEKYRRYILKNNSYRISKFSDTRVDYIQVYVVDIGKGILSGFQCKDPKQEMSILGQIFTSGKRIDKRNKNTQAGGLYMIHNVLGVTADGLGLKCDYNLPSFECERNDFVSVKPKALYRCGFGQKEIIKGFSVVGYLNIFGDVTKEYRQYFRNPDKNAILEVYRKHFYVEESSIIVKDFRFSAQDDIVWPSNVKDIIILVEKEIAKNKLVDFLENKLCKSIPQGVENIIIADFTDVEISKYYMIFSGMDILVNKLILISRSYSASVFVKRSRNKRNSMQYDIESTEKYVWNQGQTNSLSESIFVYIQWLIKYESGLFWKFLNRYQSNSYQTMYIKGNIKWNYHHEKYMTAYLDFSQASFVRECRELLIMQLFRIISIYGVKIYFEKGDRFTEDICELANAELGTKEENEHIFIGSAFVTGTSSLKQSIIQRETNDGWFYFFRHVDYEGGGKILTLLDWEENKEKRKYLQSEEAEYERVEETPFIAKKGVDFFWERHFAKEGKVIQMSAKRMYEYFQGVNSWENKICSFGHVDLIGPHDYVIFNTVEMFKQDRLESYTQPKVLDTSYDFLLFHFYNAVGRELDLKLEESVLEDFCPELISSYATKEKIIEFSKMNKNYFCNKKSLLLYFNDYATTEIIRFFQKIFDIRLNYRVIPMALVSRERGAASLLLSPLLVDSLQTLFFNMKEENEGVCRVTIFSAMLISTKLIDELKHLMFRIGADEVNVLSLIDRQRLPFGYLTKERLKTLWKLDIPPLGNQKNCAICNGIAYLEKLCGQIGVEAIRDRIMVVLKLWKKKRAFDKKLSVIESRNIRLPQRIEEIIRAQSDSYPYMNEVKITTDMGLIFFSIEDMTVTHSLRFLKECLVSELDDYTKILLLCTHLGLFKKAEISEKRRYELTLELYTSVKRQEEITNYSALALIIILSQEKEIINGLKQEVRKDLKNQKIYRNIDALICGIFVCWINEEEVNKEIKYYFNSSGCSLAEKLNAIFYYTCRQCITTHSGILSRMYDEGIVFQKRDYQEAYYKIGYLKNIYSELPEDIFGIQSGCSDLLKQINDVVYKEEQILRKYLDTEKETLIPQIKQVHKLFMEYADRLNGSLFKHKREELQQDIENIQKEIIDAQTDEKIKKTLQSVVIEWPEQDDSLECWFFWTSDIVNEISYLMMDFRYFKQKFTYCMPIDLKNEEVSGVVQAKFRDQYLEIHFTNMIAQDEEIEEIRLRKGIKNNRPSIIRINELKRNMTDQEIFEFNAFELEGSQIYDACLRIPYIYVSKK